MESSYDKVSKRSSWTTKKNLEAKDETTTTRLTYKEVMNIENVGVQTDPGCMFKYQTLKTIDHLFL